MRFSGVNLGGAALTNNIIVLYDNGVAGSGALLTVVNFTQTALIFSVPPGDGVNHTLQVGTLSA